MGALHGFAKRFRENSEEEREHAMKFIEYQNRRGGRVVFQDIAKARTDEWGSALAAVEASFELEKKVHEALLEVHKEIGDLITKMKRAGDTLGLHIIDKELQ